MKKAALFVLALLLIPALGFSVTLVRVGYINLDTIIEKYTVKYLNAEIEMREGYISQLQSQYSTGYAKMSERDRMDSLQKIRDQRDTLGMLKSNKSRWESSGEVKDEIVTQIVQRDIMDSIKKTSELEGFSIVLDNTGNFIYGSDDINLTNKVLFRLDEKLLDLQSRAPLGPISLELEDSYRVFTGDKTTE
jgi:Skp family chaperone for outer membrane proteins